MPRTPDRSGDDEPKDADLVDPAVLAAMPPTEIPAEMRNRAEHALPGFGSLGRALAKMARLHLPGLARAGAGLALCALAVWGLGHAIEADPRSTDPAVFATRTAGLALAGGIGLGGGLMASALRGGGSLHGRVHALTLGLALVLLATPLPDTLAMQILLPGLVGYGAGSFLVLLGSAILRRSTTR